jgi:hypothetical protein
VTDGFSPHAAPDLTAASVSAGTGASPHPPAAANSSLVAVLGASGSVVIWVDGSSGVATGASLEAGSPAVDPHAEVLDSAAFASPAPLIGRPPRKPPLPPRSPPLPPRTAPRKESIEPQP